MDVYVTEAEFLGVNCYAVAAHRSAAVGPEQPRDCLLVDAGHDCAPELSELLAEENLRPVAVLLTHGHPDHILGLPNMLRKWDVPVHIAAADVYRVTDPGATMSAQLRPFVAPLTRDWQAPPLTTCSGGDVLELAGLHVEVIAAPGHTEGSVLYRVTDPGVETADDAYADTEGNVGRVLFTGDVLFAGSIGRTDLPGGSMPEMTRSLEMIKRLPDAPVLPGHGPGSLLSHELRTNPFL